MKRIKSNIDATSVLKAVRKCLPGDSRPIQLHEPWFAGNEQKYVSACIKSGIVSSIGPYVEQFEKQLIRLTGSKFAIATINGTAGLHTALRMAGVEANDEVLVPSLSFVATSNAIAYCGAIPHFIDSEMRALGVDPHKLQDYLVKISKRRNSGFINKTTGRRIRAAVVVHTFGHPADLDAIQAVCKKFKLPLIEDAAESIGSYYKGKHTGTIGDFGVLSFNGNKTITSGGGGAILVQNQKLAKHLRHITTTAKIPHAWRYYHDEIGYNYRLPNLNAALGCAQLESLPMFIKRKRALAKRYEKAFSHINGVSFIKEPPFAKSNYWLNAVRLEGVGLRERDRFLTLMHTHNIKTRPVWTLTHRLPMYRNCPRMDMSVSEKIEKETINLPSSPAL